MLPQRNSMTSSDSETYQSIIIAERNERQREVRAQSLAIPLPASHIPRTESELQLTEDQAIAEGRDRMMFHRLICGIKTRSKIHFDTQQHQLQQHGSRHGYSRYPTASQRFPDNEADSHYAFHGNHHLPHRVPPGHEDPSWNQVNQTLKNIYETRQREIWNEDINDAEFTSSSDSKRITPITSNGNIKSMSSEHNTGSSTLDDWAIGEDYDSTAPSQVLDHPEMIEMDTSLHDEPVFDIDI